MPRVGTSLGGTIAARSERRRKCPFRSVPVNRALVRARLMRGSNASVRRSTPSLAGGGRESRLLEIATRVAAVPPSPDAHDDAAILGGALRCLTDRDGPVAAKSMDDDASAIDAFLDQPLDDRPDPAL